VVGRAELPEGGPVSVADAILLVLSVAMFIFLGVAMFKPERF